MASNFHDLHAIEGVFSLLGPLQGFPLRVVAVRLVVRDRKSGVFGAFGARLARLIRLISLIFGELAENFEFKTKSPIFLRLIFYKDWFLGFLKFPPLQ